MTFFSTRIYLYKATIFLKILFSLVSLLCKQKQKKSKEKAIYDKINKFDIENRNCLLYGLMAKRSISLKARDI